MNFDQTIIYQNIKYNVLYAEQEFIIHPGALGLLPISKPSLQHPFTGNFLVKDDYRLVLLTIVMSDFNASYIVTENPEDNIKAYQFPNITILYNGSVLIGTNLIKEYIIKGKPACFSYKNVYELVFEDGILITTIDQSKAMSRVRQNLELGLRSLLKLRDVLCIRHFINIRLVGDYFPITTTHMRMAYLKEMKLEYKTSEIMNLITCNE